jgi:hypothetical protein
LIACAANSVTDDGYQQQHPAKKEGGMQDIHDFVINNLILF